MFHRTQSHRSLADGIYDLVVKSGLSQDIAGNALAADRTFAFHRLYGDFDGNGVVSTADYIQFNKRFGVRYIY